MENSENDWIKNLKQGDHVIVCRALGSTDAVYDAVYELGEVVSITPKSKVRVKSDRYKDGVLFYANGRGPRASGNYYYMWLAPYEGPMRETLDREVKLNKQRQDKEREKAERISQLPPIPASDVVGIVTLLKLHKQDIVAQLSSRARSAVGDLTRVVEALADFTGEKDFYINSLGPLQGSGPNIDRLSAVYHVLSKTIEQLEAIVPPMEKL